MAGTGDARARDFLIFSLKEVPVLVQLPLSAEARTLYDTGSHGLQYCYVRVQPMLPPFPTLVNSRMRETRGGVRERANFNLWPR
eukprot:5296760-Pyramimonas_sp.AAC.1